ncbi:hypothetical protein AVEN_141175-1 [Araneus ventricosus]|uniref:Uncharacterized protein n=1 Tax=Araneus ventricosus TaxID=182803 RepID=A0A4Y2ERK7_ARAVE|nr:hypothetical protein AVEN_141175-1 [Araneus ventricosus]
MDPNDQALDYPQSIVNNSPSDFNDEFDFLSELFENSPAEDELNQNSDYQEAIDVLVNNALTPNSDNFQKNENSGKEHSSYILFIIDFV